MGGMMPGLIQTAQIADSAITSAKILDSTITTVDLLSGSVGYSRLSTSGTEATNVSRRVAKAWANFNGSTGVANAAFNIASITKNGTGDYTLNFAAALADGNYSVQITCNGVSGGMQYGGSIRSSAYGSAPTLKTASALRINVGSTYGGTAVDLENINVLILGNST
jgi:hypothetical protein